MSTNENYNNEELSLINPDSLVGYQEEKNMHHDITITLDDDDDSAGAFPLDGSSFINDEHDDDLEKIGEELRRQEDAYDIAFTKKMVEQFPHLTNPNYISSPDSDTKKCDAFTFRPPTPPKNTSESSLDSLERSNDTNSSDIGNGKFEYVTDYNDREMFINAWQAITQTNLWDFVRETIDSFTWSEDKRLEVISEKMEELGYDGHSGTSFGSTMRNMQYLARNGENMFKKMFDGTHDTEEDDPELDLYPGEDAMEYEDRLKKLIKRRIQKAKSEGRLLEYMGGL